MIEETIETPFGQILSECVDETGSTNTDLLDRIRREGLNGILLRRARNQTQARGTRGRKWDGSGGCLMFSVALPIGKDLRSSGPMTYFYLIESSPAFWWNLRSCLITNTLWSLALG